MSPLMVWFMIQGRDITNFVCSVVRMEAMVGEIQLRQGGDEAWIGGTRERSRRWRTQGAVCTVTLAERSGFARFLGTGCAFSSRRRDCGQTSSAQLESACCQRDDGKAMA